MGAFFFGMGFSSLASARALQQTTLSALPVFGTSRSEDGIEALADSPYRMHLFDGTGPGPTLGADLQRSSHVVISIPSQDRDPVLAYHIADLDAAPDLQWLCYYSTVGVYGDFGGAWIDETAPTRPINARSALRVEVEQLWREYAARRGVPLMILRLAGIYGPGRSSFDKLHAGTARRIVKPGQVFNRIHVDDIGRVTALAAEAKLSGTFNLADDEPAPPQDLVAYAAEKMGVSVPPDLPFEQAEMTPMARSFYSDNKRVSNRAIKQALGIELLYPDYRAGLDAIAAASP